MHVAQEIRRLLNPLADLPGNESAHSRFSCLAVIGALSFETRHQALIFTPLQQLILLTSVFPLGCWGVHANTIVTAWKTSPLNTSLHCLKYFTINPANGFEVKIEYGRFIVVGSRCRPNFKFD